MAMVIGMFSTCEENYGADSSRLGNLVAKYPI